MDQVRSFGRKNRVLRMTNVNRAALKNVPRSDKSELVHLKTASTLKLR